MENENIEKEITQTQPTESPENFPVKKQKPWSIIILIILLFISIGAVGFLAYTNYLLKNHAQTQENSLKVSPPLIQTITPSPSVAQDSLLYPEQRWLNSEELSKYYKDMRLISLDTKSLGKAFLAVDWDSKTDASVESGKKIALGYENYQGLTRGSRWGALNVIYSTYDFVVAAGDKSYATKNDFLKLRSGEYKAGITVNSVSGIVSYKIEPFFDNGQLTKTVVFPFENYYIVFVYYIVNKDVGLEDTINKLYQGQYPSEYSSDLKIFDVLVNSTVFVDKQF
jgi:hypothetical protein